MTRRARPAQSSRKTAARGRLPSHFTAFGKTYGDVFEAYDRLGHAARAAGPLDEKTRELVKLALAVGARLQGGVHSHTRRALDAGWTATEIRHAVVLGVTTLGFPTMMAAMSWVDDVLEPRRRS